MRSLVIAIVLGASAAHAEPLPPLVSWRAPIGCGDEAALRTTISDRAGQPRGTAPYAIAEVTVDEQGATAKLLIHAGSALDAREVHGASCEQVQDAVAWVVALAWAPKPVAAPAPAPPPAARVVAHAAAPRPPIPLHLHAAARTGLDVGTLPRGAALAGVTIGLAYAHAVELELSASRFGRRFEPVMDSGTAGVDIGLSTLAARICHHFACVGTELGSLDGTGVGLDHQQAVSLQWVAATAGARWRFALAGGIGLVVDADAVIPFARPRFTLDDGSVVYRPAPAAARLGIAVEFAPSW